MLKPSAYLTFVLEGADVAAGKASAIKRAYTYIAPTQILAGRTEAAEGEPPCVNRIALEAKLPSHDPWSDDAVWGDVMLPWLAAKLDKLFGTVRECNNEERRFYCGSTFYQEFDLSLCGVNVQVALEPDSSLRDLAAPLAAIRAWRAQAAEPAERFAVPSDAERADADWFDAVTANGETLRVPVAAGAPEA